MARLALAPEKASYRLSYASTLLFLERYEAALKEYEAGDTVLANTHSQKIGNETA